MRFLAVLLVPLVLAEICPMEKHAVCNTGHLACVCSVSQEDESPVPEISCNALIARDLETGNFPVVSVEFSLKNSAEALEEFPEDAFKDKISSSLRVDEEDIVVLRTSCQGTDDTITVQFVIQKKDTNSTALPFAIEDLIDAQSITTRMKAMGHLDQIANLDVDTIEYTDELVDLEFEPSNLELIFKAILLFLIFGFFFILGIWKLMKKGDEYADDLQKP